ncbi:di-trans,poly-cis-decaprenylcistransferase [Candidatus Micrarchaeota archaeon]|nr:MAG: di-trans,poly-cis-decaprenylcistransferase [Candidatus Micrarchaeota archaeon]
MKRSAPKHVALIPDGNRRWARKYRKPLIEGHAKGIDNLWKLMEWCREANVRTLTGWGFSSDNFKRSASEVRALMELFERKLKEYEDREEVHKHKIRVQVRGNLDEFPRKLIKKIKELEERTEEYREYELNLLIGYGGRQELVNAVNEILRSGVKHVDEKSFRKYLWSGALSSDPDLVIRTSGEIRTSGFLPWQSAYSEYYFSKKLWPEFKKADFKRALREYASRKRRFGK